MSGKKKASKRVPEYDCELCERDNDADVMVECSQCTKWYHFSCVGVKEVTEEQIWLCPICIERHQQSLVQRNLQIAGNIGEPSERNILVRRIPPMSSSSTTAPDLRFSGELTQMIQRNTMVVGDQMISQQALYTSQTTRLPIVPIQRNVSVVEPTSTTFVTTRGNQDLVPSHQRDNQGAGLKSTELKFSRDDFPPLIEDDITESVQSDRTNTTIRRNRVELERLKDAKRLEEEFEQQQEQILMEKRKRDREREERDREREEQYSKEREARLLAKFNREKEYINRTYDLIQDDVEFASRHGSVKSRQNWLSSAHRYAKNGKQDSVDVERKRQEIIDRDLEYINKQYHVGQGDEAASRSGSETEKLNSIDEWLKVCKESKKDPKDIDYVEFNRRLNELQFSTTSPLKKETIQPHNVQNIQTSANVQQSPKITKSDKASQTSESSESDEEQKKQSKQQRPQMFTKGDDSPSDPSSSNSSSRSSCPIKRPAAKRNTGIPVWEQDAEDSNSPRILSRNEIASRHVVKKSLDPFWGDPKTWPHFISQLKSTTKMCGFTDDENLNRLNECLKGKAREKVEHQLDVSGSFKIVMWTLRLIFGRPELIVHELITKAQNLQKPKGENLESLVDFATSVNGIVSMIEKAELPNHLTNPILIKELVEKLPTQAKYISSRNDVSLVDMGDWLRKLAEEVVLVTKPTFTKPKDNKSPKYWRNSSENYKRKAEQTFSHQVLKLDDKNKSSNNESKSMVGPISMRNCLVCKKLCSRIQECDEFKSYDQKKRWLIVKDMKLCKICLRKHAGFCYNYKICGKNGCKNAHHELLHDDNYKKQQKSNSPDINAVHVNINSKVHLRIVPVILYGENEKIFTYAFMDDGSTTTLIEQKIDDQLKIRGKPTDLCLLWFGKIHRTEKNSQEVVVTISSMDEGSIKYKLRGVKTVADLGIPAQSINKEEMCKKYPYLREIPFVGYENGVPGILIGSNNTKVSTQINVIEGGEYEPIAFETRIGWSIYGSTETSVCDVAKVYNVKECKCGRDDYMYHAMKEHFSIENFGVKVPNNLVRDSKENEKALNQLKVLTKRSGDRFETGLLWKDDSCKLPESYNMAFKRLQHLEQRKPNDVPKISETINDYVKKGYARKLTQSELQQHHERVWYLPTFTVSYLKKPDKIRTNQN